MPSFSKAELSRFYDRDTAPLNNHADKALEKALNRGKQEIASSRSKVVGDTRLRVRQLSLNNGFDGHKTPDFDATVEQMVNAMSPDAATVKAREDADLVNHYATEAQGGGLIAAQKVDQEKELVARYRNMITEDDTDEVVANLKSSRRERQQDRVNY
jgi:hypothetical protein